MSWNYKQLSVKFAIYIRLIYICKVTTESIETENSQQPLDKTKRCFKDSANQQIKMKL